MGGKKPYDIKLSYSVPWILILLGTFIDTFAENYWMHQENAN
jgi:hypothetical protein